MSQYFKNISRVKPYLYEVWYDELDYDFAYEYFKALENPIVPGGCSSIRNGNFLGRNFDWIYDNSSEFIVHVPKIGNNYSSIGISGGFSDLTDVFVQSGTESELYKVVPFHIYDGINSCGVCCSSNVVPTDKGENKTNPSSTLEVELNAMMIIRYVLDHFSTAIDAVEYIKNHSSIYFSKFYHDMGYEAHFMICDSNNTFIIEFINNETVIIDNKYYMTNFYLSDVNFNDDGSVYTPETQIENYNAYNTNLITLNGSGLERYNIINSNYYLANTKNGMRNLLNKLTYTKAYTNTENIWYTEFVGNGFTVKTDKSTYDAVMPIARQAYFDRNREDAEIDTWQTVHSIVYDIKNKNIYIITQEDSEELIFNGDEQMFRIMLIEKDSEDVSKVLYRYLMRKDPITGVDSIYEIQQLADIDAKVEAMLNGTDTDFYTAGKTFSKGSFIIVRVTDYGVKADIYEQ